MIRRLRYDACSVNNISIVRTRIRVACVQMCRAGVFQLSMTNALARIRVRVLRGVNMCVVILQVHKGRLLAQGQHAWECSCVSVICSSSHPTIITKLRLAPQLTCALQQVIHNSTTSIHSEHCWAGDLSNYTRVFTLITTRRVMRPP
jgi:hypothetical protein